MAKTPIKLIHDLEALEAHFRQVQANLSHAFGESENGGLDDDLLLDEASRVLNGCFPLIDDARLKVAAYEGLSQASKEAVS